MGSSGWQGSAQFIDENQRRSSYSYGGGGSSYSTDMYGKFPTDQIIGQQAVSDKAASNYEDAQKLLNVYGDRVSSDDRSFLQTLGQNTGFFSALSGVGKVIEFLSRPIGLVNLAIQEHAPSGPLATVLGGPAGLGLWKNNNEWSNFFKSGEDRAVESGESQGINARDYWLMLSGQREDLAESIGETLAGDDGFVSGSSILEAGGLTVESLDKLPDGIRQLARIQRFGMAMSEEIAADPLTYMSFGTGGMGRKVAMETATASIDEAARLARTTLRETGGAVSEVARESLTELEKHFYDDALEKIVAKTKAKTWAKDTTWVEKVDDVMDFRTAAHVPDAEAMSGLKSIAIKAEEDMYFGSKSRVAEIVDDVVHEIEVRNYGRGLSKDSTWELFKAHAKAGKAPLWTTGGLRIGPPAMTPNQRGFQFTIPGTEGMFRATGRGAGRPVRWAMSREGVSDSSWLRHMDDLWEKQIRPMLASDKPYRIKAKKGTGYYAMQAAEHYAPRAVINSLGEATLNEEMFNAVGLWGRAKRAISEGVSPSRRDEMLSAVLAGVAAGSRVEPPPGATAKEIELFDEFVSEFSNIFERMGEVAAIVDPSGIGKVAGQGRNFRPFIEMPEFTEVMRGIASVYGDVVGGAVNLQTIAGRETYAKQLTDALKKAGIDGKVERADLDLWLQQLGANENAPRVIHAVGQTEQMRFRRAGRHTVLSPVFDEAGELVGEAERGTFVSLPDLNESLMNVTNAVLQLHDIPLELKTAKTITKKGATKITQALELDPGKQIATWLVDMTGVIAERAKQAEGIISGHLRHGVSVTNEAVLRAGMVESGLLDGIAETAAGTDAAVAARIELANAGPETVRYTVGGVVMHPPVKIAEDPAWIHMAESIDIISGELDATMTEFPRQYQQTVDDLVAAGEDPAAAMAMAFNSLAYKHGEAQEVFVAAVGDILRRFRDEAIHVNIAAGDTYTQAIERAVRMTQKKSEMLQAELDKLRVEFAGKYDEAVTEIKMGSFSLFDSDEGGKAAGRAASQRTEQIVNGVKDSAKGARATESASTGADALAAKHTAEVREMLADWAEHGTDGTYNYSIDHVELSKGLGGTMSQAHVAQGADTVIVFYHPSWVKSGGGTTETRRVITDIVGKRGDPSWSWWNANMIALDPAGTMWVPRVPTDKKLIVFSEVAATGAAAGGDVLKELESLFEHQSAALRRYIGDSGFVGIIGPDEIQQAARKEVVPASTTLRDRYGVDGQSLTEFAMQNGTTEAELRAANPGKIRWFSERHAGRRQMIEQAIEDPARAVTPRPKLSDFNTPEEFKEELGRWYEGKSKAKPDADAAVNFTMGAYTPYWNMEPETLRVFDRQMSAIDTAIGTDMSNVVDVEDIFYDLDLFGASKGFTPDEVRVLYGDWIEHNWDTISEPLRVMYQESHRYGRNPYAWDGELKAMRERWKGIPADDYETIIRKKMDEVRSRYVMFDDAGNEMGARARSRGSMTNDIGSEKGSTDFEWIPASTEMNIPPKRYRPGSQVRATPELARQRLEQVGGVTAGAETRIGYEQMGSAVPAVGKEAEYLPERATKNILENQNVAATRAATDYSKPLRDNYDTVAEFDEALKQWAGKKAKKVGRVASVDADAYAQYPTAVQGMLAADTTVMDRAAHLASRQEAEWFEDIIGAYEPLLSDPAFVASLNEQAVTVDDVIAVIDRFRATSSFTQVYGSNSFRKFLATALDYYDKNPEGFLEAAYAVVNYNNKTTKELSTMLKQANIPGRSKAKTKAAKIALLNDFYGNPAGEAVVVRGVKMPRTTTGFGRAGTPDAVNVGRVDSGGVVGRRSGVMFGNTHRRGDYTPESITKAVKDYERDLDALTNPDVIKTWEFREDVADLAGRELLCPTSSPHSPCHAEVLARKADELVKLPYEVSTAGDERFSALVATLEDGRTIEEHYQVDWKGYPTWRDGKGKKPIEGGVGFGKSKEETAKFYYDLWRRWADQNPELLRELHELTVQRGRTLSDMYSGKSLVNQADALTTVMKERFPVDLPVRDMPGVKAPVVTVDPRLQPRAVTGFEEYTIPERLSPVKELEGWTDEQIADDIERHLEAIEAKRPQWEVDLGKSDITPEEALDLYRVKLEEAAAKVEKAHAKLAAAENSDVEIPDSEFTKLDSQIANAEDLHEQIGMKIADLEEHLVDMRDFADEQTFREVKGVQEIPGQITLGDAELRQIYADAVAAATEPVAAKAAVDPESLRNASGILEPDALEQIDDLEFLQLERSRLERELEEAKSGPQVDDEMGDIGDGMLESHGMMIEGIHDRIGWVDDRIARVKEELFDTPVEGAAPAKKGPSFSEGGEKHYEWYKGMLDEYDEYHFIAVPPDLIGGSPQAVRDYAAESKYAPMKKLTERFHEMGIEPGIQPDKMYHGTKQSDLDTFINPDGSLTLRQSTLAGAPKGYAETGVSFAPHQDIADFYRMYWRNETINDRPMTLQGVTFEVDSDALPPLVQHRYDEFTYLGDGDLVIPAGKWRVVDEASEPIAPEAFDVAGDVIESTPEKITELGENEVFVFGSNEEGRHGKGAAKTAADKFGAEQGKGLGMSGQSYAIPTKDGNLETLPMETIEAYVRYFMDEAAKEPGTKFYVTKLGTGLAGIPEEDMAAMFRGIDTPPNVVLPDGWRGAAADVKLVDDQLPIELQPNLAGEYPPDLETLIDERFKSSNKANRQAVEAFRKDLEMWNEVSPEERAVRLAEANKVRAELDLPPLDAPTGPVPPIAEDLGTRQDVARSIVAGMEKTGRLDNFIDKSGRKPAQLRITGMEQIRPSGRQTRVKPREMMASAESEIARLIGQNKKRAAEGLEPLPIPDKEKLAEELASRITMESLTNDLVRQREYLRGENAIDVGGQYEGEKSAAHLEALARNNALIPEVEAGQFAVPPFPLTAPVGPINAITLGVSGLQYGADMWFTEILTDMGVPLIHHVVDEDYTKFAAKYPGVIDERGIPLPPDATRDMRKKKYIAGLATRSMRNADEADITIAFMPHIKDGERTVGTMKTIEYVLAGGPGGPTEDIRLAAWDKSWGAHHGVQPQLMDQFMEVHPGSHIYVPKNVNRGLVVVVNGDPSDEGLRILREILKGKVNIAGPRPDIVANISGYRSMVEKTLKASAPGRAGIAEDAAKMASLPPQPVPLSGIPTGRMNARIDQVDSILDEMAQNPISKMEEMSGFVERVTALRDGDRINRMRSLVEAANEPGNIQGVKEFEQWYGENADEVDALIRATYGDDHTLVVKRVDGRFVPTVEHPYAEQVARAATGKDFNQLVDDVISGTLSKEEALAKGMDTLVVAADLKQAIEKTLAERDGLLNAPVTIAVSDMWKHEQVIKDFDVLTKLIDSAIQTGNSKTLRRFIGTEMRDGTFKTSVSWGRISDALSSEPLRLEQLQRWVEAAWVADTPWDTEKAFLSWWMQERTLLSRLTYTVDQLRHQMARRITDAYVENIWFGTHANAEQAAALTERMMSELAAIPNPPAAANVPIDTKFIPNAELTPILSDRLRKGRVPARNAEALGIELNFSDRMRNLSDQLRQWSRAPEFKAADGKEFLPRGDMSTASDWFNHLADRIDDQLASQTVRERIPAPGMVTAESQGLGAGILAGYDVDPDFAHMFRETTANLGSLFTPYGFDQVKGATNYLTQMWKRWATVVRPSFHIRNVIGGVVNGMFGGVMPWDYYRYGPQVMKFRRGMKELSRGSFDVDILRTKGAFDGVALKYVDEEFHQIFRDAWNEGIIQTGFARTEGLRIADYSKGTINPFNPDFYLASLGGATMESLEDVLRLTMYGKYHQMGNKTFGHSMVNMLHFDYTDLTPIEETIKKFVPFYVWTRRNVPLQLRIATAAPGYLLAMDKIRRNWNDTQKLEHPDMYQPYMDSSGWLLPFGRQDEDGWAQLTWKPDLPFMDLDDLPLFAEGEGAWPVGRSAFNVGAWMQYGTDMLGPAFSVPYSTLTLNEAGSVNAPRGIAEIMQVLDAATNAVGAEGMVQTGHAPDGTPTDVQIPKLMDTLWHGLVPPAEDYLAMMGISPRNPYRAADEGWLNSDDPAFWSFEGVGRGWMRGVGRGAGLRYDSPRQSFFDQQAAEDRISRIEYDLKRGIGG